MSGDVPGVACRVAGRNRRKAGLTLIEVMLAVVILGVALVVLVSTAATCLSVAKKARNYETARELLARLELEHPIKKKKIDDFGEEVEDRPKEYRKAGAEGGLFGSFLPSMGDLPDMMKTGRAALSDLERISREARRD